jgi:hypothetical protein
MKENSLGDISTVEQKIGNREFKTRHRKIWLAWAIIAVIIAGLIFAHEYESYMRSFTVNVRHTIFLTVANYHK